jgi:Insecticide toxin TcdB middle/C-terminal region
MVEQWDTEQFAALTAAGALPADNNTASSHVPPVHTKTWFHTGVYLGRDRISRQFEREYFLEGLDVETARPLLLEDTVLPAGLTLEEEREACRALKGAMLRQEVYADDADRPDATPEQIQRARIPYTVTEQNFTIRTPQPRGSNRHAVFFTHAREAINYHYERNPNDPRIQHAMTLEVDDYGNVLKEAAIGYGRRMDAPDVALLPEDRAKQRLIHITCTENELTNAIGSEADAYRTPLAAQSRTYELRKPQQEKSGNGLTKLYRFEDMADHVKRARDGAHDIDYEDFEFARAKQAVVNDAIEIDKYFRRLIEHVRTFYRKDDITGLLPLGQLEPLALPGRVTN